MKHLQAAGFSVETQSVDGYDNLPEHKGVPASMLSCHTAKVGPYLIEGHVPAEAIKLLLAERPKNVAGIGVQGMPAGSPGMDSSNPVAYNVIAWRASGETFVFAKVSSDGKLSK